MKFIALLFFSTTAFAGTIDISGPIAPGLNLKSIRAIYDCYFLCEGKSLYGKVTQANGTYSAHLSFPEWSWNTPVLKVSLDLETKVPGGALRSSIEMITNERALPTPAVGDTCKAGLHSYHFGKPESGAIEQEYRLDCGFNYAEIPQAGKTVYENFPISFEKEELNDGPELINLADGDKFSIKIFDNGEGHVGARSKVIASRKYRKTSLLPSGEYRISRVVYSSQGIFAYAEIEQKDLLVKIYPNLDAPELMDFDDLFKEGRLARDQLCGAGVKSLVQVEQGKTKSSHCLR